MDIKYYAKYKSRNESMCLLCKHYITCHRIRASDCFEMHQLIYDDFVALCPNYFKERKNAALAFTHKEVK